MKDGMAAKEKEGSMIELTVHFANGGRLTAEEVALVEAIRRERSILGASRATGVSYRKCWLIVDALNRTFEMPIFATYPGRKGGGAELTPFGERVIALYRSMERRCASATKPAIVELTASLDRDYQARASLEGAERRQSPPQSGRWRRS